MKHTILIYLLFMSIIKIYPQTGWVQQNSGTFVDFKSVSFADTNIGFAVGDTVSYYTSSIFKTTNGGTNWVRIQSGLHQIFTIQFINSNTGFAGSAAYFYKTTNGGITWYQYYFGADGSPMNDLFFINS